MPLSVGHRNQIWKSMSVDATNHCWLVLYLWPHVGYCFESRECVETDRLYSHNLLKVALDKSVSSMKCNLIMALCRCKVWGWSKILQQSPLPTLGQRWDADFNVLLQESYQCTWVFLGWRRLTSHFGILHRTCSTQMKSYRSTSESGRTKTPWGIIQSLIYFKTTR